jgi:hypothetical protein
MQSLYSVYVDFMVGRAKPEEQSLALVPLAPASDKDGRGWAAAQLAAW